ncbi:ribonuclease HII [Patescibacteria group bacterium]|nr:ribonuclease HII [Patescibacteria group bacterium]
MKYPNFSLEKKLIKEGYQNIVGIDEVGRGAWAGPIIAVAAMISYKKQDTSNKQTPNFKSQILIKRSRELGSRLRYKIKDSKLLSEKVREAMFEQLSSRVIWSLGIVTHREIDKLGLTRANILVIKRALRCLEIDPDYLLIDKVNGFKYKLPHQLIVKGDRKILSIAVASILAKVTRDRMMRKLHQKFPQYHFHRHKGYGTKLHQDCLKKNGACRLHRLSYKPIRTLVKS